MPEPLTPEKILARLEKAKDDQYLVWRQAFDARQKFEAAAQRLVYDAIEQLCLELFAQVHTENQSAVSGKPTKADVRKAMDLLTDIIRSWNDAAADEDRGRDNNSLVLLVTEEGKGNIYTYCGGSPFYSEEQGAMIMITLGEIGNEVHAFDSIDQLTEIIADETEIQK